MTTRVRQSSSITITHIFHISEIFNIICMFCGNHVALFLACIDSNCYKNHPRDLCDLPLQYLKRLSDSILNQYCRQGIPIRSINCSHNNVTDNGVKGFGYSLKELYAPDNRHITDDCLKELTKLIFLDISYNTLITDKGIEYVPQLKYINVEDNERISDKSIRLLHDLCEIRLEYNPRITAECLETLNKLEIIIVCDEEFTVEDYRSYQEEYYES